MTPRLPQPSPPESAPPTIAFALITLLVVGGGFVGLVSMVLPQFLFVIVCGLGVIIFFAAQYFLWARWLYPIVRQWEIDKGNLSESEQTNHEL